MAGSFFGSVEMRWPVKMGRGGDGQEKEGQLAARTRGRPDGQDGQDRPRGTRTVAMVACRDRLISGRTVSLSWWNNNNNNNNLERHEKRDGDKLCGLASQPGLVKAGGLRIAA